MQLPYPGFPSKELWHKLFKQQMHVERLGFPKHVFIAGKQLSPSGVLNCFVKGRESLTGVDATIPDLQEQVCILIWLAHQLTNV